MICAWAKCGKEFEPVVCGMGGRSGKQRYCTKRCQRHAYYEANPSRYRAYAKGKLAEDPRRARDRTLWRKYKIRADDYDRMLAAQAGKCAICGGVDPRCSVGEFFSVDHDHATGEVRGLLCGHCNRGLGMFLDSPELLGAASAYICLKRLHRVA